MKQPDDKFTRDVFDTLPHSGALQMKMTDKALADLISQLQLDHTQVGKEFLAHDGYSDELATEICHLGQAIECLNSLRTMRAVLAATE
ncbi:hypothetical protein [Undibacterium sp. Tian12W]|uniref:hypothetical protein n=1 Tax=Undibacterium sp. Tian12W TaxID=3413054 RepID=UPI003BF27B1D